MSTVLGTSASKMTPPREYRFRGDFNVACAIPLSLAGVSRDEKGETPGLPLQCHSGRLVDSDVLERYDGLRLLKLNVEAGRQHDDVDAGFDVLVELQADLALDAEDEVQRVSEQTLVLRHQLHGGDRHAISISRV